MGATRNGRPPGIFIHEETDGRPSAQLISVVPDQLHGALRVLYGELIF
jgi:hypothetical protein